MKGVDALKFAFYNEHISIAVLLISAGAEEYITISSIILNAVTWTQERGRRLREVFEVLVVIFNSLAQRDLVFFACLFQISFNQHCSVPGFTFQVGFLIR